MLHRNRTDRKRGRRRILQIEPLESRQLLAGDPILSEFLASNRDVLDDGNGNSSDWIEITNAGDASIDLHQWYLTDDSSKPRKWQFPDLPQSELEPGEQLVVFASGDGRVDETGYLHTSFRLSADGEYVALVMPDGQTVKSEFGANGTDYPEQFRDVSFGVGQELVSRELIGLGASAHVLIPDALSDERFGTTWQGGDEAAFDAVGGVTDWTEGHVGVGFDTGGVLTPLLETDVSDAMNRVNTSAYIRVPFQVSSRDEISQLRLHMLYDDGFVAYINGTMIAANNAREQVMWNSRATATHDGQVGEDFDIPIDVLVEEDNVLAIHGLNRTPTSSDFLISPQLVAQVATGVTTVGYMLVPTPNAPNRTAKTAFVDAPQLSVERGYYDSPIDVSVTTATPGATIAYTTDGSEPSLTNGVLVAPPDLSSTPTVRLNISETITLRTAAFKDGLHPNRVTTHTYIFVDDVITQRDMDPEIVTAPVYRDSIRDDLKSIPTMSLVLDHEDFFGRDGIHSKPSLEGPESERPVSVEYFDPHSDAEFQIDAGIRIHGADARNHKKKPLRLLFRSEYGEPNLLYPLFPGSPVNEFDKLILRGGGHEGFTSPWGVQPESATFIRDQFQRDTERVMGQLSARGTFVHVYINGRYWGLYNLHERPDADFQASHLGGDAEEYDVIATDGNIVDGNKDRWNEAMKLARAGLESQENYATFQQLVDVDSLIDNMILRIWAGDIDWLRSQHEIASTGNRNKNWYAATNRNDGQFKFFVWDAELSMGKNHRSNRNLHLNLTDVDVANSPGRFYAELKENPSFRLRFADRLHAHFFNDGALTPPQAAARWNELADHIRGAVVAESARWGDAQRRDPLTRDETWQSEVEWVANTFIPRRRDIVLEQFRGIGLYPNVEAPVFQQRDGNAPSTLSLSMSAPAGIIYYTTDGSDPRDPITGEPLERALPYSGQFALTERAIIKARALGDGAWSALNQAEITATPTLPGDANRDGSFNASDIVSVIQSAKYQTGADATWSEGDWNGDGVFDHLDLVASLVAGNYSS